MKKICMWCEWHYRGLSFFIDHQSFGVSMVHEWLVKNFHRGYVIETIQEQLSAPDGE